MLEAMFKDFCGFRIAYAERRLDLGIVIVLSDPPAYFAQRKNANSKPALITSRLFEVSFARAVADISV